MCMLAQGNPEQKSGIVTDRKGLSVRNFKKVNNMQYMVIVLNAETNQLLSHLISINTAI